MWVLGVVPGTRKRENHCLTLFSLLRDLAPRLLVTNNMCSFGPQIQRPIIINAASHNTEVEVLSIQSVPFGKLMCIAYSRCTVSLSWNMIRFKNSGGRVERSCTGNQSSITRRGKPLQITRV